MNSILERERAPRIRVDVKGTCEFKNDERVGWVQIERAKACDNDK